jgi:hypothetical protein
LQLEISRRQLECEQKGKQLQSDIFLYVDQISIFSLAGNLFKKKALLKADQKLHLSDNLISLILPLLVNKLVLRNSGALTKSIAALLTGKLSSLIDAKTIITVFNQAMAWMSGTKKKAAPTFDDYGIPPDSETY